MARIILFILLLLFTIGYYFYSPSYMDTSSIGLLLSIAALAIIVFFTKKEKEINLKKQYLKHSTLVIFGFVVVHFQYHIDFLLGYINNFYPYIWVQNDIVVKALAVSVSGLLCFLIGYLWYKKKKSFQNSKQENNKVISIKLLSYLAAVLLAAYFYYANPLYLMGFYGAEDIGAEAAYIILVFKTVVFAVLIQTARNFKIKEIKFTNFLSYAKSNSLLINILIGVYLTSVLISGDRGPIIFFGIAYFGNYLFVSNKKLNIYKTVGILVLGAAFITILGKVRSLDRNLSFSERFSTSLQMDSRFETKSILPQTQELATSIRALHHTVNHIPNQHDYLYGRFQLQQALSIIPFGNSFVQLIFEDNSYKYRSSAHFITWIILGDNPYMGHGSSVTSDFYFDFGLLGVLVGMFIFGYVMRYAEVAMYSQQLPSLFTHAFFIVFLSSAIYISRSTFLIEMKAVVWTFFILFINQKFINKQ